TTNSASGHRTVQPSSRTRSNVSEPHRPRARYSSKSRARTSWRGNRSLNIATDSRITHSMPELSRRDFLKGVGLVPLAAALPGPVLARALADTSDSYRFFTTHEAAVVREATARIIPGPTDDPTEVGHPGAREANVVRYIDTMLAAFSFHPPRIFAGGPFSNRAGASRDDMARFVPPP